MGNPVWPAAARWVAGLVGNGTLKPGDLLPSATALAGEAGGSPYLYKRALASLARDGILDPPVSKGGRYRVPGGDNPGPEVRKLSAALAEAREATGLNQVEFAKRAGLSWSTVHVAETGHFERQTAATWAAFDRAAAAGGKLARMHVDYDGAGRPRRLPPLRL